MLFWAAFILTRPLGATVGDFFDKPHAQGGLNVSRPLASAILAAFIVICIVLFPQRAGTHVQGADRGRWSRPWRAPMPGVAERVGFEPTNTR